jgi:hypothetical protein
MHIYVVLIVKKKLRRRFLLLTPSPLHVVGFTIYGEGTTTYVQTVDGHETISAASQYHIRVEPLRKDEHAQRPKPLLLYQRLAK